MPKKETQLWLKVEWSMDMPFNIHNLRKSAREHCNFFTAALLVVKFLAAPAFPFTFKRPMVSRNGLL